MVANIARIPPKSVSRDDKEVLKNLERDLKTMVFGQDKAIEALAAAIKLARAGLRDPEKPIGSYLFSGPTGVGKTEVARQLARTLGIELTRFDMSEYMERHTVSRLIGAPPGYVGFDQGGLLTDAIDQHPHSVLLLDEIEKAHPDLFNILLQVMDYGKLTDHNGKTVDFRNVILIMTTNAGAADLAKAGDRLRRRGAQRRRRGGDQPHVHAGVPQPARCHHLLRAPSRRRRSAASSTSSSCSSKRSSPTATSPSSSTRRRAHGWRRRATTSCSAPGRWRASSRSTSRSRWPKSCCSASSPRAAWSRVSRDGDKLVFSFTEAPPRAPAPKELEPVET